jgi:transitional endoplasmic reticulum ATPase
MLKMPPVDAATLEALALAFQASPDNAALLGVVLRGCLDAGTPAQGLPLLRAFTGQLATEAEQALAARVATQAGAPDLALELLRASGPAASLERARAQHALGELAAARRLYQEAVDANGTLEDPALAALLAPPTPAGAEVRRLRVVSNDDVGESALDRLLEPDQTPVTFDDVAGLTEVKTQVERRIVLPFMKPGIFSRFKRRAGGGILMYGPPGCGKTLLARATAGQCKARFFNVAISDVLDMYIGESEQKLHALFEKARSSAPAVLFFDELEALGGKRQYTREAASSKLVSQFLSEMDGFSQANHGVLVLAATNVPWAIDSAFRRPGRFDRVLFVPPPDREARKAILQLHLAGRPVVEGLPLDDLARRTSGFSGADLAHVVETAADEAIQESLAHDEERPIAKPHLEAALKEVRPTTGEWLTTARNYARYANEGGQYDEVLSFLDKHGKG